MMKAGNRRSETAREEEMPVTETTERPRRTAGVVNSEWRTGIENERDTVERQLIEAEKVCAGLKAKLAFADRVLDLPFASGRNGDV